MKLHGLLIREAQVFKILLVISSKHDDLLGFREFITLFSLASVIRIIFMLRSKQ